MLSSNQKRRMNAIGEYTFHTNYLRNKMYYLDQRQRCKYINSHLKYQIYISKNTTVRPSQLNRQATGLAEGLEQGTRVQSGTAVQCSPVSQHLSSPCMACWLLKASFSPIFTRSVCSPDTSSCVSTVIPQNVRTFPPPPYGVN